MTGKESNKEIKMKELFEAAHKDRNLRQQLLEDPASVAKKWNVKLESREVERLRKVGAFAELANEAKYGRVFYCNPQVCYPATVWLRQELIELLRDFIVLPPGGGVTYPGPIYAAENRLTRNLDLVGRAKGGVIIDG